MKSSQRADQDAQQMTALAQEFAHFVFLLAHLHGPSQCMVTIFLLLSYSNLHDKEYLISWVCNFTFSKF